MKKIDGILTSNSTKDLKNLRFGYLTVVKFLGGKNRQGMWECICSCGNLVIRSTDTLRSTHKSSCGCIRYVELHYDPETGVLSNGTRIFTPHKNFPYITVRRNNKILLAHRIAWEIMFGEIPIGMEVDHINRDKTDNRICNLRLVTHSENAFNVNKRLNTSSKFKGVSWNARNNCWEARCKNKRSRHSLEIDAAAAYNQYLREFNIRTAVFNDLDS